MSEKKTSDEGPRGSRRKRPAEGEVRIDFGLGDIFKGIGNLLDMVNEMAEAGQSEVNRTGEVKGPGGVRGVYGVSVRTGLGGKPVVEPFGNIRSNSQGAKVSEVREPLVDVFDEKDHFLIIVELPGVAESDVRVEAKDDIVTLNADGRDRQYAKEILLPAAIDPTTLRQSYQNGILEVRLDKAEHSPSREGVEKDG